MFYRLMNCLILFAGPLKQMTTKDKRNGEVAKSGGFLGNPASNGEKTQQPGTVCILVRDFYCSWIILGPLQGRLVQLLKLGRTLNCKGIGLVIHHLLLFLSIWKTLLFTLKNKYYNNYPSHQDPLPTTHVPWAVLTLQASPK